jgi:hypothetical protein
VSDPSLTSRVLIVEALGEGYGWGDGTSITYPMLLRAYKLQGISLVQDRVR